MGMPMRRYLTAVPGLAAVWGAGWPGACAVVLVVVVIAAYRLLAERERRKTLLVTYLYAPVGTVMARGKDPAGPQLGVWVGGGHSPVRHLPRFSRSRRALRAAHVRHGGGAGEGQDPGRVP